MLINLSFAVPLSVHTKQMISCENDFNKTVFLSNELPRMFEVCWQQRKLEQAISDSKIEVTVHLKYHNCTC